MAPTCSLIRPCKSLVDCDVHVSNDSHFYPLLNRYSGIYTTAVDGSGPLLAAIKVFNNNKKVNRVSFFAVVARRLESGEADTVSRVEP